MNTKEGMTDFVRVASDLSLMIIVVGVRGSGKSLLLTHFSCEAEREAYAVKKLREIKGEDYLKNRKVSNWINYPVKRYEILPFTRKRILLEPAPLDIEKLIIWHDDFENGNIFFDEIDQVADRQDWQSTVSKMINQGVQVMRHRNLSLYFSVQSLNWLNARLQWQADIIIKCSDLAFTGWGRNQRLRPGEVSQLLWIDKSGIMTGHSYEELPIIYKQLFFGKRYWNNYRTRHDFNIADKAKYTVKRKTKQIDLSGEDTEELEDAKREIINKAMDFYKYSNPGEDVRSDLFWKTAEGLGFPPNGHVWGGKELIKMGVTGRMSGGYKFYNFSEVTVL